MAPTTILVIDNHEVDRSFLAQLCESRGYLAFTARDGAEALEIVRREKISLIVSEVLMPVMGGLEFANRLHAEPAIADVPVIFTTSAYQASEIRALARQYGVDTVLSKPLEAQIVTEALSAALGTQGVAPAHSAKKYSQNDNDAQSHQQIEQLKRELRERVRATEELKESETRFRQLAENIHEVCFANTSPSPPSSWIDTGMC